MAERKLRLVGSEEKKKESAAKSRPSAFKKPKRVQRNEELNDLWDEVVPVLEAEGLAEEVDSLFLEKMLRHFMTAYVAHDELHEEDTVAQWDEKNKRYAKHPSEAIMRAQSKEFLAYAKEAGITFRSRQSGASTPHGGVVGENPFQPKMAR